MNYYTKLLKSILCAVLTIATLAIGKQAIAQNTWEIGPGSGNSYIITRSGNISYPETVKVRTVSVTAFAGKHFISKNTSLSFGAGEDSKPLSISETSLDNVDVLYRFQAGDRWYYRIEVTDQAGAVLATRDREIYIGTTNSPYHLNFVDYCNKKISDLTFIKTDNQSIFSNSRNKYYDIGYNPPTSDVETTGTLSGYVLIDDSYDYSRKSATVHTDGLFATNRAGGNGEFYKRIGDKLHASVYFTEKEKDDGYAYVQILTGESSAAYDGADPDGSVNDPVNSIYKACFELKKGSGVYSGSGFQIFPHSNDYHNQNEEGSENISAFYLEDSYLWQQKYRSESLRAINDNNAFVLDPDVGALTVRFDCAGSGDDTYGYKDLKVRWALLDSTPPTVLTDEITVSPGIHTKGNPVTISIPFSEPVKTSISNVYTLKTSWGDLVMDDRCTLANLLSFTGNITANPGTALQINGIEFHTIGNISEGIPIKDLMDYNFSGTLSKSFNITVDASYSITCDPNGGYMPYPNPAYYTSKSDAITLINPVRTHYLFRGWTGTGLSEPTMTVTIPAGSTGDRSYTATWAMEAEDHWTGDGSISNPYIITTAKGLSLLAVMVEIGNNFDGKYFELGADIDMSTIPDFKGIGSNVEANNFFSGSLNGKSFTISNLNINNSGESYGGLFGKLDRNGSASNIIIDNATIIGGQYVGGIAGVGNGSITGCSVINSSISAINGSISGTDYYVGGLVGRINVSALNNNIVSNTTISGPVYVGAAAGYLNKSTCYNNFIINCTKNGSGDIYGGREVGGTYQANHYRDLTIDGAAPVSNIYTVTAASGITVSGEPTRSYDGIDYYVKGKKLTISSNVSAPPGGTVSYGITAGGADITSTALSGSTLTMPEQDVCVVLSYSSVQLSCNSAIVLGEAKYVTTFYHGTTDYQLPEGSLAYTASLENGTAVFHRIGDDSNVIPHGTAVVIVADAASITLSALSSTDVTANPGNILRGTNTAIDKPAGNVYVLGANTSGEMIFKKFSGSSIPAGKAYYVTE